MQSAPLRRAPESRSELRKRRTPGYPKFDKEQRGALQRLLEVTRPKPDLAPLASRTTTCRGWRSQPTESKGIDGFRRSVIAGAMEIPSLLPASRSRQTGAGTIP